VYRSLGFHAVNSAFKRADKVAMVPDAAAWQGPESTHPLEKRLHAILAAVAPPVPADAPDGKK